MTRPARILPGPRCGWSPDPELSTCRPGPKANIDHSPEPGGRRIWSYHDVQCQVPNPQPGPHLDGYPECGLVDGHKLPHDYRRHAAVRVPGGREHFADPRPGDFPGRGVTVKTEPEPEMELEIA